MIRKVREICNLICRWRISADTGISLSFKRHHDIIASGILEYGHRRRYRAILYEKNYDLYFCRYISYVFAD